MNTFHTHCGLVKEREGTSWYLPDTVAFPGMELGVDTRDAALTEGAVPLQVPMVAWPTHTCGCPGALIIEPTEDDTGADASGCSVTETKEE